ncbi:MAG: radical SAM protein [Lentisphaerota bacterium]
MKTTDFNHHPCFNKEARMKFGRIHLPVAPACNVQCNFCNRRFDCVNESRPGVTSAVLSPGQALMYLQDAYERRPNLSVVGIAGPGDPFANAEESLETLRLVRAHFPNMLLCVATNGLGLAPYIEELARLRVSHITITINAVNPEIGAPLYAWIRPDKKPYRGVEGATLLLERQREAMAQLKETSILVKINTIIVPGVNEQHIPEVAQTVKDWGASIINCIPLIPAPGSAFEQREPPAPAVTLRCREEAGRHLPLMSHCAQCRADACGIVGEANTVTDADRLAFFASQSLHPAEHRPYVAAATREGLLVNQHLGEAGQLAVFDQRGAEFFPVGLRRMPEAGLGAKRWMDMADLLKDCRAILVSGVGPSPRKILAEQGLKVIEMEGLIEEGLSAVFAGKEIPPHLRRRFSGCGAACSGNGQGCG